MVFGNIISLSPHTQRPMATERADPVPENISEYQKTENKLQ
jgi:hypothetical protein